MGTENDGLTPVKGIHVFTRHWQKKAKTGKVAIMKTSLSRVHY